jgi:hypothetical protein
MMPWRIIRQSLSRQPDRRPKAAALAAFARHLAAPRNLRPQQKKVGRLVAAPPSHQE